MKKTSNRPAPFDTVRAELELQYQKVHFLPETGLTKEELVREFEDHCAAHPDEARILTKAWLLNLLCRRARIAPEPGDYFVGKIEHHKLLPDLRSRWWIEQRDKHFQNDPPEDPGAFIAQLDCASHICPDWNSLLKLGLRGVRDRAAQRSSDYHKAVALVFDGIMTLVGRFDAAQPELGLAPLIERPPQTLQEALQLTYLYHELIELDGVEVRSMGRFDQIYHSYYINDLKTGILTRESAGELLKYFWIKFFAKTMGKRFGKPFTFGPMPNELTYTAFEVYHEMRVVDPKFHLRLSTKTPEKLLKLAARCIQDGCTGIVVVNNDAQVKMLEKNGKTPADADDYVLIGCYEPAVMGRELNCSGAGSLNLAKPIEQTVASGNYPTFDDFFKAYLKQLRENLTLQMDKIRRWEELWPWVNPAPLISGPMNSCSDSGRDISAGGAEYNTTGICCIGLADAVDSLAAVRQLVYEQQRCTFPELRSALAANWKGFEALRQKAIHHVPKWGNNNDRIDLLAVIITELLGQKINHEPNARGGVFQAALYGIIGVVKDMGFHTGALPDGRLANQPLTMNTGAEDGRDENGVTSLINSVSKIDLSLFPNGTVLDIMLHPSTTRGEQGINTIIAIIRSLFEQGGMALQFNIFDREILRDAQVHPEKYASLQVRVCGWNVRFIDLASDEQDIFITKAEDGRA